MIGLPRVSTYANVLVVIQRLGAKRGLDVRKARRMLQNRSVGVNGRGLRLNAWDVTRGMNS